MVTNWYLGIGEKREDESTMTPGFGALWLGGRTHLDRGRGLKEEADPAWGC